VRIDGPPVLLEPTVAQAFAVALHELATNAAKYGSLSGDRGQVDLEWLHKADGQLIFRWMEMGGPVVQMPRRQGFGTRVIERMIGQLKGKVRLTGARRDSQPLQTQRVIPASCYFLLPQKSVGLTQSCRVARGRVGRKATWNAVRQASPDLRISGPISFSGVQHR
jgi:hypothetical protein